MQSDQHGFRKSQTLEWHKCDSSTGSVSICVDLWLPKGTMKPKNGRSNRSRLIRNERGITRRDLLKGVMGAGAAAALSGCTWVEKDSGGVTRESVPGRNDLVRRENEKPGTRDWLLTNTRIDPKTRYRCPWIEGYCSRTSVRASESISFHVSTNPPSSFILDVYRMGYYGSAGARLMRSYEPFKGLTQPD